MVDIRSYRKEKREREQNQTNFRQKLRLHKLTALYRVMLVVVAIIALVALVMLQYQRHIYTGYDIVSSVERDTSEAATDVRLYDSILTYSRDGAHCTDAKGNVVWNETYQIQDILVAINQDVVAIGSYNGREIYISNTKGQLGSVDTAMPIRNIAVSATGHVTAVLADTNATWVNTYNSEGELQSYAETHMQNSGYPAAISLSPNGELLAVSYVYIDAGTLKTNVVFYNFGAVGTNQSDYLVSADTYTDMLIPEIRFMDNETAYAVGDGCLVIYKGGQVPKRLASYYYSQEVQSVFSGDRYVGLVFTSNEEDSRYRLEVYNTSGGLVGKYPFQIEYTDIFFGHDNFTIYNEKECVITTFGGVEKYNGPFTQTVNVMIPVGTAYKYLLVTNDYIDTIQLK